MTQDMEIFSVLLDNLAEQGIDPEQWMMERLMEGLQKKGWVVPPPPSPSGTHFVGPRRSGRTTWALHEAARYDCPLLVADHMRARAANATARRIWEDPTYGALLGSALLGQRQVLERSPRPRILTSADLRRSRRATHAVVRVVVDDVPDVLGSELNVEVQGWTAVTPS